MIAPADFAKRNPWIGKVVAILFAFFLFAILEFSARLVFKEDDELSKILRVLRQEPYLFWSLRPNLDTTFQGVRLKTNSLGLRDKDMSPGRHERSFRIVCMGASPTFGWGVRYEDAYPHLLEELISQGSAPDTRIEVINAGIIGYSSYQGLNLLRDKILDLSPDIITVSYLVNDVDKYRFYRSEPKSDKELAPKSRFLVSFENVIGRSGFFRLLKKGIFGIRKANAGLYADPSGVYPEKTRVSPDDYRANLEAIIRIAEEKGIKSVLVKMPISFPFKGERLSDSSLEECAGCIAQSRVYAESGMYDKAIAEARKALEFNPYSAEAFYYLGVYYRERKEFKEANGYFQKAKEMELFECAKLGKAYNDIMEQTALENRIPLVDVASAFEGFARRNKKEPLINPGHDFVHPSVKGHRIISREIKKALIKYGLLTLK